MPTPRSRSTRVAAALLAATMLAASPAPAPTPEEQVEHQRQSAILGAQALQAFATKDFARARDTLLEQAALDPDSFVARYNLACAHSALGEYDAAEQSLDTAIEVGFDDVHQLRRDDYLAPLRERERYTELLNNWPAILEARRAANLTRDTALVSRRHERRTLEPLRVEVISDHDPASTDAAVRELEILSAWMLAGPFAGVEQEPWHSHAPWVNVVVPSMEGFTDWQLVTFGPDSTNGFSAIGGAYDHDRKRLVSRDLGATLRHEYVHVLHWRDMARHNQRHAHWIQEGIASLVEDYDLDSSGNPRFVPSWRTNMIKRLLGAGRLQSLEQLANTQHARFSASRPLAKYAHARAVFLYLADRDRLVEFYRAYVQTHDADPTGLVHLRATLGFESQDALEQDFRAWVRALPDVPETGSDLSATLGVEIEEGTGDGPVVVALPIEARKRTGLHLKSVITAINDRPTRDMNELIRVLGDYRPGQTVTLSHRRGRLHKTSEATLLPRD